MDLSALAPPPASSGAEERPDRGQDSASVRVENSGLDEAGLGAKFSAAGLVVSVALAPPRSAVVCFADRKSAEKAVQLFDDASNWRSGMRVSLLVSDLFKKKKQPQLQQATAPRKPLYGFVQDGRLGGLAVGPAWGLEQGDWASFSVEGEELAEVRKLGFAPGAAGTGTVIKLSKPNKKVSGFGFIQMDGGAAGEGALGGAGGGPALASVFFSQDRTAGKVEFRDRVRFVLDANKTSCEPVAVQVQATAAESDSAAAGALLPPPPQQQQKKGAGALQYGIAGTGGTIASRPGGVAEGDWVSYRLAEDGQVCDVLKLVLGEPGVGTVQMMAPKKYGFILPDGAPGLVDAQGRRTTLFFSAADKAQPEELARRDRVRYVVEPSLTTREPICVHVVKIADAADPCFALPRDSELLLSQSLLKGPKRQPAAGPPPAAPMPPPQQQERPMRLQLMKKSIAIDIHGVSGGSWLMAQGPAEDSCGFAPEQWLGCRNAGAV